MAVHPIVGSAHFGGSADEFDDATEQYCRRGFLRQQPDSDRRMWLRAAMHAALRIWLQRGVDGFRVDAIERLIRNDQYRDDPISPCHREHVESSSRSLPVESVDRAEGHETIAEMRGVVQESGEPLLIGRDICCRSSV